jgi:hypothetical protein
MSDLYVEKVLGWREDLLYWKSISQKERDSAPTHCGPHGSYPLGPGCKHVRAARRLAKTGHGSNPSKTLSCVNSYASAHGCGGDK